MLFELHTFFFYQLQLKTLYYHSCLGHTMHYQQLLSRCTELSKVIVPFTMFLLQFCLFFSSSFRCHFRADMPLFLLHYPSIWSIGVLSPSIFHQFLKNPRTQMSKVSRHSPHSRRHLGLLIPATFFSSKVALLLYLFPSMPLSLPLFSISLSVSLCLTIVPPFSQLSLPSHFPPFFFSPQPV